MSVPRRPDPEPLQTDDVRVVTVGTAIWAVGLVLALLFRGRLEDGGNEGWVWVLLAGTFLGLLGLRYVRRRRDAARRPDVDPSGGRAGPNPS